MHLKFRDSVCYDASIPTFRQFIHSNLHPNGAEHTEISLTLKYAATQLYLTTKEMHVCLHFLCMSHKTHLLTCILSLSYTISALQYFNLAQSTVKIRPLPSMFHVSNRNREQQRYALAFKTSQSSKVCLLH
jgi:hypothetical protein